MRHSKSKYPIGAAWKFVSKISGSIGTVWLAEISYGHEIWRWNWMYSDGSGVKFDYCYNRSSAVSSCAVKFRGEKVRFKRVVE